MDLILLIGVATALFIVILTLYFFSKQTENEKAVPAAPQRGVPQRAQEGIPRRAQIARNQRNRLRTAANNQNAAEADDGEDDSDNDLARDSAKISVDEKMGAKKRAKLEAKAEKKAQREAELQLREEKKKKETLLEEERKKNEEKLEEVERKREEAERLAREEKERKDYEEYLKMKEAFSIEEEGFEEDDSEKENLLAEFIQYIKDNKVVVLEDLGMHFKLKTQQVIERITDLQKDGLLTGVVDDRGKFIYISEDELQAVAKFIRQRGRVSITELAECSNNLINLSPVST